jgi:hypothetical protein
MEVNDMGLLRWRGSVEAPASPVVATPSCRCFAEDVRCLSVVDDGPESSVLDREVLGPEDAHRRPFAGDLDRAHPVSAEGPHALSESAPGDQVPLPVLLDRAQRFDVADGLRTAGVLVAQLHDTIRTQGLCELDRCDRVVVALQEVHPGCERAGTCRIPVGHDLEHLPGGGPGSLPERAAAERAESDEHREGLVQGEPRGAERR